MANGAKLIISVTAGVVLGQEMPEYSKRWTWMSEDQEKLVNGDKDAQARYIQMAGESREYAAWLENPRSFNWVIREWIWC